MIDSIPYFGAFLCFICFFAGQKIQNKTKSVLANPILLSVLFLYFISFFMKTEFKNFDKDVEILNYLLTPATICLGVPLYKNFERVKKELFPVLFGITSGVLINLFLTTLLSRMLYLSNAEYITFLPKSVTLGVGKNIADDLGGIVGITSPIIILTGIFGNIIADKVIRIIKIKHQLPIRVLIGTSTHAIGTTKAFEIGDLEGAASSFSLVVAAIFTVILMPLFSSFHL